MSADSALSSRDFAADGTRLSDPSIDFPAKIQIATAVRDAVDSYPASDLITFLSTLLPLIVQLLKNGQPVFTKDAPEQQFRHLLLEILHRMPPHEHVRPLAHEIMNVVVQLIRTDNEENVILAIKVAVDMYRAHKQVLESQAQNFIDTIHDMYKNMSELLHETFEANQESSLMQGGSPPKSGDGSQLLPRGMKSFRVMAECPIATIVFSQSNAKLIAPVVEFLQLEAAPQKRAHDEAAARGEIHVGISPYIKNKVAYVAFITAQVKGMSLLAYVMRIPNNQESIRDYQELFPQLGVRLLQDIPLETPGIRKEMGVAIRHIVTTDSRTWFSPYLDRLLDDRLLVGSGLTGYEQLRPFACSTLADLVHCLRMELSAAQLTRVVHLYSCHLHDPTVTPGIQNMCTKVLVALHDPIVAKLPQPDSSRLLTGLLESYISKLHGIHAMFQDLINMMKANMKEKEKGKEKEKTKDLEASDETTADEVKREPSESTPYVMPAIGNIEKQKPIQRASYVVESNEETMRANSTSESRLLFRTLLHGIRGAIVSLRSINGGVPDSEMLGRFFEGAFKCLSLWPSQTESRDEKEVVDWFSGVFHDFQPHVFQEVWTLKMDFFINISLDHPFALQVANGLMANAELSRQLTSIMLKHLVDRLDLLGDQDAKSANVTLRLFKMVFMTVNLLPDANEAVLAPHLTRLIMDSFPLAAKAKEPTSYYLLIRALFRSISGGKFERVYNEILPLLQELLENLNRLISHSEGPTRDLLVELCLTVPVRLTHLLPYLQHLMRPLVLALRGSGEMAAQGLRTLELCIDNLTQDFLEPCFAPVRRELMGALYDLLRPLPASHLLSHACIRILGKLGGRNRRLQYDHPLLDYHPCAEEASLLLSFDGRTQRVNLGPMATMACDSVRNSNVTYRKAAFDVLRHVTSIFLQEGAQGREREAVFTTAIEGLFNAIQVPDLQQQAIMYLRDLSRHIFIAELLNREPGPANSRRYPMSPLATIFVEWLPRSLAWNNKEEMKTAEGVIRHLIEDLAAIGKQDVPMDGQDAPREPSGILHNLASAFVGMCHDESWRKKMAGCKGITIMASTESLPAKMTLEREFDFVRALISVLKDMPVDPPRDIDEVTTALMDVIKKSDTAPAGEDGVPLHRVRMPFLTGILHMELASSNAIVRSATQKCIQLLSELSGKTPTELLLPHRERLLMPIYTKPLRALSFATQIGHIDAVTYCLGLQPPLPEANEELMRLLSEALALADAEDQNLLGRVVHRQNSLALNRLRVACIKLLTASMPVTDFFSRQLPVRQRAIGVYFKSLYSSSVDVKNAAHDGLRVVLQHQTRLPKELLQTGLRPILMNLADPKRISVSGLDGLARLLELLTHYFKVEIGMKLLEHYSSIADANMLHEAAFSPLTTNEEISKLVKLVNIFHLLPPAANMYLDSLSNLVVETEGQLHAAAPTPFTEPYGKYVDRYAEEAVEYFCQRLQSARHVQTLRNILISGVAPNFRDDLMKKLPQLIQVELDVSPIPVHLLLICQDLVKAVPSWLDNHPLAMQMLISAWRKEIAGWTTDNAEPRNIADAQVASILLTILTMFVQHSMRVDLLFELVAVYAIRAPIELSSFSHFLYQHVIATESVTLKHEVLVKFMEFFDSSTISWAHKTQLLAVVINPLLLAALARKEANEGLLDTDIMGKIHVQIWQYMANGQASEIFPGADDAFKIQLLQLSKRIQGDSWIRTTRFVINDEGHTVSALVHIYQVIIGHPDVFYECRDFLIPHMTMSLQKIGLNSTPVNNTDTRALSLDAVDLILSWERRQQSESESMDTSMDESTRSSTWTTPLSLRENIVSYILRFITSIPHDQTNAKGALASRALQILEFLLGPKGWPEVTVKIKFFEKVFAQLDFGESGSNLALNNTKALAIVLKDKDDAYFVSNAATIQTLLERPMTSTEAVLHETLQPVLNRLLTAVPPPPDEGTQDAVTRALYTFVENTVNEGLKNHTNLSGTLAVLHSLILVQPKKLEVFAGGLMKALTKLTKDYTEGPPAAGNDLLVPPIKSILEICRSHVGFLGENRQTLLKAFVQLSEKSQSIALCRYLMDVAKDWTIEKRETMYPTLKEKATILHRMIGFMRDETLWSELLTFIFQIYTEPALRRSELTIRLEPLFLLGCRAKDPVLRGQFIDLYDESLPRGLCSRLQFVLGSSCWESIRDHYWIPQALDLLLGSVDDALTLLPSFNLRSQPITEFSQLVASAKIQDLLRPSRILLHLHPQTTHLFWVSVFKAIWATLSRKEQHDVTRSTIALLSKDYHFRQADVRINVIQSFLAGIHACSPPLSLPPYLVKYLGKTFNAWHIALEILQTSLESYREEETSRDGTYDALAELYSELSEDDMFYGLWRRRSLFNETNVAISFEQAGMYTVAQQQYEIAQIKARSGAMAFNEAEYCVWEDHWILAAQKLQQWDTLMELARAEENPDLLLECAWRTVDWNAEREMVERALTSITEVATPRRRVFEGYTALVRSHLAGTGDRYHETAWIINRFAHVARKHHLSEVCHTSLAKIYTLPNIEISEAFLKLREQARCHYQNPNELHAGLEVINNTNLMYFSNSQKAEFHTLKGMFIAKLGHNEEANGAFGQAVQTDLGLAKAWAEWGRYNDRLFKDSPNDMSLAANAVSCYLQAAGLYKSAKTRPLIIRVLWLLNNDDNVATVARAFDAYKGDLALWYWITVIPQLLLSLTYREAPHARNMLIHLAKNYPQALFFHLRTLREDLGPLRKKHAQTLAAAQAESQAKGNEGANVKAEGQASAGEVSGSNANGAKPGTATTVPRGPRQPWDNVDEIVAILKTAFPLLALTMETMVDQFAQRFKATQEEELVRYFNALLMEALQCHSMSVTVQSDDPPLPPQCLENVTRFADTALHPDTRAVFKEDVIEPKPSLREYIRKLQRWRDKYEKVLEARPRLQPLDVLSHWLVEFQHSKFDEVEVPGQYLEHKDMNTNFVRIARFASQYELCLGMGFSYRRITILGHDGTKHSFVVQLPTSRNCRREERLHQLFRIFNSVLIRRKETRKRVLSFYLPAAVPLNPTLRLLENDSSVVGLQDIYDQHLRELGMNKEDPVILHAEKFRSLLDLHNKGNPNKQEYMNLRLELFDVVATKMVPNNILSTYMSRSMANANALWLLRKQFTTQMAAVTLMSYVLNCITRTPSRYHISRSTGQIYMSDFVPGYRPNQAPAVLGTNEAVPFRFTPNFQTFIGPIGMDGLMAAGMMAIGRTLTEPEFDLEQHLGLFIRDELIGWHQVNPNIKPGWTDQSLKPYVAPIVEQIVKKAELLSCRWERESALALGPGQPCATNAVQSVVSLISNASNPQLLSRMAEQWLPWL
ncbi:hypothetical protein FRB99_005203 [Tulasnella sp. 403]|nr:hypothetical protein FRB99_005203 [Tulasnella sp. 403]